MTKMLNCTLHTQTVYLDRYAVCLRAHRSLGQGDPQEAGGDLDVVSHLRVVGAIAAIPERPPVALVGGHMYVIALIVERLAEHHIRSFIALTERQSDENGRFVFNLQGLVEHPYSAEYVGMYYDTPLSPGYNVFVVPDEDDKATAQYLGVFASEAEAERVAIFWWHTHYSCVRVYRDGPPQSGQWKRENWHVGKLIPILVKYMPG